MFRRSAFIKFGYFDTSSPIDDFYILFKMLLKEAKIVNFKNSWAYYRVSKVNYVKKTQWYFSGLIYTLSKYHNSPPIKNAIRHHIKILFMKRAIFNGIRDYKILNDIFKIEDSILYKINISFQCLFIILFPGFIRNIFKNKIVYKLIRIPNFIEDA